MTRTVSTIFLIAAMAVAAHGQAVQSFSGGTQFSSFNSDGDTVGWFFSTSTPISVTDLGFWDAGQDGLADRHQVGIWDTTNGNLLTSTFIPAGTSAPLVGEWRYASITPINLNAGTQYVIGAYYNPNPPGPIDNYIATVTAGSIVTAPGITFIGSARDDLPVGGPHPFSIPTVLGAANGRFGPNFQFVAVPEASSLILVALGVLSLLTSRRRIAA